MAKWLIFCTCLKSTQTTSERPLTSDADDHNSPNPGSNDFKVRHTKNLHGLASQLYPIIVLQSET